MVIEKDYSLKNLNSWKINCKAKEYTELKSKKDFIESFKYISKNNLEYLILGGGSNIVFIKELYDGLVIKMSNDKIDINIPKNVVTIGAGCILDNLIESLGNSKIHSMASLTSIPGTVGGAIYGNAGAYGLEIGEMVKEVKVFDTELRKFITLDDKQCDFKYRNSIFKSSKTRYIIYEIILRLKRTRRQKVTIKKRLSKFIPENIRYRDVRNEIAKIREDKFGNLDTINTTGSIYKNTIINQKQLTELQKILPCIPFWNMENNNVKIPTGYLLDKILDLKGKKIGNILINAQNTLVFYAETEVKGQEVYNLVSDVKEKILNKTGISIESEVIFV